MKCKICKKYITGRIDKIFCSIECKNYYHTNLRKATRVVVKEIDTILHRNRSILLEILGKNRIQIKVNRILLEKKKFRFKYHTHLHVNKNNKTFYYVYDLSWMEFSDDEILIKRKNYINHILK